LAEHERWEKQHQLRINAGTSDGIRTAELEGTGTSMKRQCWTAKRVGLTLLIAFVPLGYGYWWVRTSEPVNVVLDQLRAVEEGQHWRAYEYLSASARKKLSLSEFRMLIEDNSILEDPYSIKFPSRSIEGNTATISGVIEGYGEYSSDAKYVLIREEGQWRIESFEWGPLRREASGK